MSFEDQLEEQKRERRENIVAWAVVALLVAIMFLRVLIGMALYDDPPRTWQYRVSPQIPAQSYSSTAPSTGSLNVAPQVPLTPREKQERQEKSK